MKLSERAARVSPLTHPSVPGRDAGWGLGERKGEKTFQSVHFFTLYSNE